jgi:signal transduction histidine kinase
MTPAPRGTYGDRVLSRLTAQRVDHLLAPVLVAVYEVQVVLGPDVAPSRLVAGLVGAPICAGIAFRRRWPLAVGVLTQLTLSLCVGRVELGFGPITVAWFSALYALTVWTSNRLFPVAVAFVLIANAGIDLWREPDDPGVVFGVGAVIVMVLVRIVVGSRDRQLRLADRERQVSAREAVVGERERIARELHDVIGHHVSTMVVQAGAERRMLPAGQGETREVLGTIERLGRGALDEMRRMVTMLRLDPDDDLAPAPSLHDLPELVARLQDNGVPVELVVDGDVRDLPAGIELSAYRIVQEALTNVVKHAGGAPATVCLVYRPEALEISVRDEGTNETASDLSGGHGLVGMRERVAMYGGRVEAGRSAAGGFVVRVLLPVTT